MLNLTDKAKLFNDFFSKQCKLIINDSILPTFKFLTEKRIHNVVIESKEILNLVRNINPNKAAGSDEISGHMLLLCDKSVVLPLKIIYQNILAYSVYPDIWKLANVTPIFKKEDKQ